MSLASTFCSNMKAQFSFFLTGFHLCLQKMFRITGVLVAKNPIICLLLSTLFTLLSAGGLAKLRVHENMKTGYTSVNAPSRREYNIYKEFFKTGGEPYTAGIFISTKDGANLLEEHYFDACKNLYDRLTNNLTVIHGGKSYSFSDLCHSHCQVNMPLWMFKDALQSHSSNQLTYPVATVSGLQIPMGPFLHGVSLNPNGTISHVSMLALWFRSEQTADLTDILRTWELAMCQTVSDLESPLLDVIPYGENMINAEVLRGGLSAAPHYTIGVVGMLAFVMATLSSWSTKCKGVLLSLAVAFSPMLASVVTFGLICAGGFHLNAMSLVTPFLVLAIGVDDAFLLIHSWKKHSAILCIQERLGLVFSQVGISITVTSLTNLLAFAIGAAVPTPELRLFCLGAALAMGLDLGFQLFFFSPLLVLCGQREQETTLSNCNQIKNLISPLLIEYCHALTKLWLRLLASVSLCIYLLIAFVGISAMRPEMDAKMLLPKDSDLREAVAIHEKYIWSEYHQLTVIVNSVPHISNSSSLASFERAVHAFENMPQSLGPNATFLWLKDYLAFQRSLGYLLGFDGDRTVDYQSVPEFLQFPLYRHWAESVSWRKVNDSVIVDNFLFRTAYGNLSSMGEQAQLLVELRRVAAQHHEFNLSVWVGAGRPHE